MDHADKMHCVEMMARGDDKWDLSPNDLVALGYVLQRVKDLELVCDNRGRREDELRAEVRRLRLALEKVGVTFVDCRGCMALADIATRALESPLDTSEDRSRMSRCSSRISR